MEVKGALFAAVVFKKPEMGAIADAFAGFALKVMPEKMGLFAPDYTKITRNKTNTKILQEDPLVLKDKIFAGNLQKMMGMIVSIKEEK